TLAPGLHDFYRPDDLPDQINARQDERQEPPAGHLGGLKQWKSLQHRNENQESGVSARFLADQHAAVAEKELNKKEPSSRNSKQFCRHWRQFGNAGLDLLMPRGGKFLLDPRYFGSLKPRQSLFGPRSRGVCPWLWSQIGITEFFACL